MSMTCPKLGVIVPSGKLVWWRVALLESLRSVCPGTVVLLADQGRGRNFPLSWRLMPGAQGIFAKQGPDVPGFSPDVWPRTTLDQGLEADLDLVIDTCPGDGPQEWRRSLSMGIWRLEAAPRLGFGPGFLESRLLWLPSQGQARLIANTFTCVPGPGPWSWSRPALAKAALLPARALARFMLNGRDYLEASPLAAEGGAWGPGPGKGLALLGRLAAWGLGKAWRDLFYRRQWFLASRPGNGDPGRPDFFREAFKPLYPPKGSGWADPFLVHQAGSTYCFIEEITPSGKGVISVMELDQGLWSKPRQVLAEPHHLSYPFVFSHAGQMYLMPESAQARQVVLYRAEDFPGGWVLDRVLLPGVAAVDATLLEHGGRWWMFVNQRTPGGSSWDELHLYHALSPLGPFTAHPANPVVSDVRRARPAGRIFSVGDRLYRPGQDCSSWYGRALALMEIERLDVSGYAERPVARLEPGLIPGGTCLHTLAALDGLEMVDGQRFVPLWPELISRA